MHSSLFIQPSVYWRCTPLHPRSEPWQLVMAAQSSCSQWRHIFYSAVKIRMWFWLLSAQKLLTVTENKVGFHRKKRKKTPQPQRWFRLPFLARYIYTQNSPLTETAVIYKCTIHILNYFKVFAYSKSSTFDIPGHINTFNIMK